MKKIISIILALCVVLSCVVSVSAMNATQNQVESLVKALSIMNGDENGNLNPTAKITRAEIAKVICLAISYK